MMGATMGGEFGSLFGLIAMLEDSAKYESKLAELAKKVVEAQQLHDTAVDKLKQSEANQKTANEVLEKGEKAVQHAQEIRAGTDQQAQDLVARARELDTRLAVHAADIADLERWKAEHHARRSHIESELTAREAAVKAAEAAVIKLRQDAESEIEQRHRAADRAIAVMMDDAQARINSAEAMRKAAEDWKADIAAKHQQVQEFFSQLSKTA